MITSGSHLYPSSSGSFSSSSWLFFPTRGARGAGAHRLSGDGSKAAAAAGSPRGAGKDALGEHLLSAANAAVPATRLSGSSSWAKEAGASLRFQPGNLSLRQKSAREASPCSPPPPRTLTPPLTAAASADGPWRAPRQPFRARTLPRLRTAARARRPVPTRPDRTGLREQGWRGRS